jgi:hypothetical protein
MNAGSSQYGFVGPREDLIDSRLTFDCKLSEGYSLSRLLEVIESDWFKDGVADFLACGLRHPTTTGGGELRRRGHRGQSTSQRRVGGYLGGMKPRVKRSSATVSSHEFEGANE